MSPWIEAMRLRTLPVSASGVIMGWACATHNGVFRWFPALCCLLLALLAQIASNFGNEYFDYRNGLDKKGREGFRRGVTEGDISPRAMLIATLITLAVACGIGVAMMIDVGCYWLIIPGVAIALFALAYSSGPYPLSHHGLGDLTVVIFFGIIPVSLTCFVSSGSFGNLWITLGSAAAIGLMASNVLIVNNYRDTEDDKSVGKNTTVVIFGRKVMSTVYLLSGVIAVGLTWKIWVDGLFIGSVIIPFIYLCIHLRLWYMLRRRKGADLNPLLGMTACNLLQFALFTGSLLIVI